MHPSRLLRFGRLAPLLASLVVLLCCTRANAQFWAQIGTLGPPSQSLHCVYFWNSQNGVAAGPFQGLWNFRNGIWTHNTNYTGLAPQSLRFINGALYAACYLEAWKSLDSGLTWQRINFPEPYPWDC